MLANEVSYGGGVLGMLVFSNKTNLVTEPEFSNA